jgi:hypothetical protein
MKDIKFSGGALTSGVTFRVDSISGHGNLTVMETYGLNDRKPQVIDTEAEKGLLGHFAKLPGTFDAFIKFAKDNGLELTISETNGNKPVSALVNLAVIAPVAASTTADTTPTFSGTATPGAAIAITIGATTVNTTATAAGTWTVDFSVLTSGAKSASVVASKDGKSATVVVAFTIS